MRNLITKDLFTLAKIVGKTGIKEKIKDIGFTSETSENEMIVSLIFEAITSAPDAEKEIFTFLADVADVTVEQLQNDEFDLLLEIIEHLKAQEKLVTFLKQVFKFAN